MTGWKKGDRFRVVTRFVPSGESEGVVGFVGTVDYVQDEFVFHSVERCPHNNASGGRTWRFDQVEKVEEADEEELLARLLAHGAGPCPVIPQDDEVRKAAPMYRGLLAYFPGALFQVASHSLRADLKHNAGATVPGKPVPAWNRGKSMDHDDCIVRHTCEQHTDPLYHKTARAWRALADLQEYLEREHGYAPGEHSWPAREGEDR